MSGYTLALLIGAVIVAAINYNLPRAALWIAVGALNFALTSLYFHSGLAPWWLPHAFVTGIADAVTAILLAIFGAHVWERLVRYCFMLSVLISMSMLLGWIPTEYAYRTGLELCNWLALLVMGGHGLLRLADDRGLVEQDARAGARSIVHRARMVLDAPRQSTGVLARAAGQR